MNDNYGDRRQAGASWTVASACAPMRNQHRPHWMAVRILLEEKMLVLPWRRRARVKGRGSRDRWIDSVEGRRRAVVLLLLLTLARSLDSYKPHATNHGIADFFT